MMEQAPSENLFRAAEEAREAIAAALRSVSWILRQPVKDRLEYSAGALGRALRQVRGDHAQE